YRHCNGSTGIHGFCTTDQAVSAAHGDTAHHIVPDFLGYLHHQLLALIVDLNGVEQGRQLSVGVFDVQNGAGDLNHLADVFFRHGHSPYLLDFSSSRSAGGTTHDLGDLLGDGCLAGTVVIQIQVFDHLRCVL